MEALEVEGGTAAVRSVSRKLKALRPGKGVPEVLFGPKSVSERGRIEVSVTRLAKDILKTRA